MAVIARNVITIPITPFMISKATIASLWKSGFMGDTFVRNRSSFEKYQRSAIGDMAKLALKHWLESNDFEVTDWDDVRTSWRSQRKTFDLQVNGHNIEVRSSVTGGLTIAQTINRENIIHPCNVRVKEITVQVFFPDRNCTEAWLFGFAEQADLEDPSLRSPRRIGPRLVDFYLMPFSHRRAKKINQLLSVL